MTLILAVASRAATVLVTDREVTRDGVRFDPWANKTVVYRAPNGIVALAYTGIAYLEGMTTDQWLVETITGFPVPRSDPPNSYLGVERLPHWPDVGLALRKVQRRFAQVRPTLPAGSREAGFEVLAVGYQWKGLDFRPVTTGFFVAPGGHPGAIWSGRRHFDHRRFEIAIAPAENGALCDIPELQRRLRAAADAGEIQGILADVIRVASGRSSYIGADCLAICIDPPGRRERAVHITYLPSEHAPTSLNGPLAEESATAFSPWIVQPHLIHAPSLHRSAGALMLDLFGYTARIRGAEDPTGMAPVIYFRGQTRKRWP